MIFKQGIARKCGATRQGKQRTNPKRANLARLEFREYFLCVAHGVPDADVGDVGDPIRNLTGIVQTQPLNRRHALPAPPLKTSGHTQQD
jgi:hypothetical protein